MARANVSRNGYVEMDYLLRYHFHIDPEQLDDEEWATAIAALEKIRKDEAGGK